MKASLLLAGGAAVVALLSLGACGGDDDNTGANGGGSSSSSSSSGGSPTPVVFDCEKWKSKCANEPARTQDAIDSCKDEQAGPCGSVLQTYKNCLATNEQCTSDGLSDTKTTSKSCSSDYAPVSKCLQEQEADAGSI